MNNIVFNGTPGTGSGQTIAIVDAYDDSNIQSDLNQFDTQFGLPATTVTRVNQTGGTTYPSVDPTGGWELEESLDVEWAHAMAPGANILLVEASSSNSDDIFAAVSYASAHASVVSMSWGGGEYSTETADDSQYFVHSGVVFVASSGDSGAPAIYPSASPDVLSVGGTALTLTSSNDWSSEAGWSGSTGGPSAVESQPAYQTGVVTQTTTARATPDVAYDASPSTGVSVYDTIPYNNRILNWLNVGGTAPGTPVVGPAGDRRPGPSAERPVRAWTAPTPSRSWTSCTRTQVTSTTSPAARVPARHITRQGPDTIM